MGHMAHLSRLPGSTSWGISISKEPVGARPLNGRKLRTEVSPHHTQRHPPRLRIATYTNGSNNPRRRDVTDRQGGRHHEEKDPIDPFPLHRPLCRVCPCRLRRERIGRGQQRIQEREQRKGPVAKKTDFIWFKVEIPESVGVSDSAGKNADRVQLTFPEDENGSADRFIPVWKKALTAEESHADQAEKKGDTFQWKDGGSVEYNGRTWLVGTYEDNSGVSTLLFTDVEPGSVYVLISNFGLHKKEAEALLNSIEFPDDMAKAVAEAREVEISSIEIKH